jgi:hypothetical protein
MLKYINTARGPIVFSDNFNHSDFKNIDARIESAGCFVAIKTATSPIHVAIGDGGSMTLGVASNPEKDKADLERLLNRVIDGD